jgi:hypothetical protein
MPMVLESGWPKTVNGSTEIILNVNNLTENGI